MQAVSPKIVADGLVLPLLLQRNAVATSITSIKLCNKVNSWAATPLTVTELRRVDGWMGVLGDSRRVFLEFACASALYATDFTSSLHFVGCKNANAAHAVILMSGYNA